MAIHLPENLEHSILAAVHSGKFSSMDDAMTQAARLLLATIKQDNKQANTINDNSAIFSREAEFKQQLLNSGFMTSLPSSACSSDKVKFQPVALSGEPLSETIIRERR